MFLSDSSITQAIPLPEREIVKGYIRLCSGFASACSQCGELVLVGDFPKMTFLPSLDELVMNVMDGRELAVVFDATQYGCTMKWSW